MSSCRMFLTCVHVALPSQTLTGTCPCSRLCSSMYGIKWLNFGIAEWEVIHSQLEVNWTSVTIVPKPHLFQKLANHNKTMALVFIVVYCNLQPRHMYKSPMCSFRTRSARFTLSFKSHLTFMRCTMRFWHSFRLGSCPPDQMSSNMSSASRRQSLEQDCSAMMGLHPMTSVKMKNPNNTGFDWTHFQSKMPLVLRRESSRGQLCDATPVCMKSCTKNRSAFKTIFNQRKFPTLVLTTESGYSSMPWRTSQNSRRSITCPRWTKKTVGAATNPQARTIAGLFHDDPVHPG